MAENTTRADDRPAPYPKIAACECGGITVTVTAAPQMVHACSCLDCQRRSGSAFSYSAFFPEAAVTIGGEPKRWRGSSDAGRWGEANFCPTCGVTVFSRLEALPELVCVAVGCFSDPDFPAPAKLYWNSRRHHWLDLPAGIGRVETQ
jgi:hypothetical protein